MKATLRHLLTLVLALAVVLGTSWQQALVVCGMADRGMHCCCDHDEGGVGPVLVADADDACCSVQAIDHAASLFADLPTPEFELFAEATPPEAALTWPPARVRRAELRTAPPRGPPDRGEPLYIEVCSLLI